MRKSRLPQELIDLAQKCGLAGRRVYIPKQSKTRFSDSPTLVTSHATKTVLEVESTYEQRGVTFYLESSPRKSFSSMFGKSRTASTFNLKLRTASRVVSAAYKVWREWFSRKERITLEKLRDLAEEAGIEYSSLYLTYLKIREQLRKGEKVDVREHAGYHQISSDFIQHLIMLAKASIESCTWRSS